MIEIKSEIMGRGIASFYIGITLRTGQTLDSLLLELAELKSKHPDRAIEVGAIDKEHIVFIVRPTRAFP